MTFPPAWLMAAFVAVMYLACYGAGTALCLLAGLRLRTGLERFGVASALGAAVLGWLGFLAALLRAPLLAACGAWVCTTLGLAVVVRRARARRDGTDDALTRGDQFLVWGGVAVGLLFTAALDWGQTHLQPDGSLVSRFLWPDLLYRQAVVARLYNCDGFPCWPWLAGAPMKGMSLLRFAAVTPVLRALGLPPDCYQSAAVWLGLFGVPVAGLCAFALFRGLGAGPRVSALAVLLTSFLGKPRWLLAGDMAHSPALHWAGSDVFAIAVPVLLALLALLVVALRERRPGPTLLAVFMLLGGLGHVPWEGLSVYAAVPLWLVFALGTRQARRTSLALAAAALGGVLVLKLVLGSGGVPGASPWSVLAPGAPVRNLSWAFPFLAEPLRPLLAAPGPANLLKLLKFAAVFPVAALFFVAASAWVRLVALLDAPHWRLSALRRPEYGLAACWVVTGVLLSTVLDFRTVTSDFVGYNALRLLWPALLVANLAVAVLAVRQAAWLRTRWGVLVALLFVLYGSWENTQLALWSRTGAPVTVISAAQMRVLHFLAAHAGPQDTVLLNPRYKPPAAPEGTPAPPTHAWGYVSGLVNAPVYLDNDDMSRKFALGTEWDRRWAELQPVLRSTTPGPVRDFLQRERVQWVLLEQAEPFAAALPLAGFREVFAEGNVRLYGRL